MPVTFFPTNPVVARSIGAYNQGLTEESLGRMRENAALETARMQAQAQQQALQYQAQQNQQANALRQQEMQNESAYRNQMLGNQRAQTEAQMAWQRALMEANGGQADKDRTSREKIAGITAGARTGVSPAEIESINNTASSAATRYNAMLDLEKKAAEIALDDIEKRRGNEWFTLGSTAKKEKDEALKRLRESGYVPQVQKVLGQLNMDKEAAGLLEFNGQRFIPKMLKLPGQAGSTSTAAPQSSGVSSDALIREAQDAISRGANPAAVQERLQKALGVVLPSMGSGFFGGTNTANVWPPMQAAPVAQAPAVSPQILPIPSATVAPRTSFFGEQFPPEFSDLGRQYFQ
jgi:hypothetical protein